MAMNAEISEVKVFFEKDEGMFAKVEEDIKKTMNVKVISMGKGNGPIRPGTGVSLEIK